MLRPAVSSRSLGIAAWKDALLLTLLVTALSSLAVFGIRQQIAPASQADGSRAREIEALFASIRRASARCVSAPREQGREAQSDAQPAANRFSDDARRKP